MEIQIADVLLPPLFHPLFAVAAAFLRNFVSLYVWGVTVENGNTGTGAFPFRQAHKATLRGVVRLLIQLNSLKISPHGVQGVPGLTDKAHLISGIHYKTPFRLFLPHAVLFLQGGVDGLFSVVDIFFLDSGRKPAKLIDTGLIIRAFPFKAFRNLRPHGIPVDKDDGQKAVLSLLMDDMIQNLFAINLLVSFQNLFIFLQLAGPFRRHLFHKAGAPGNRSLLCQGHRRLIIHLYKRQGIHGAQSALSGLQLFMLFKKPFPVGTEVRKSAFQLDKGAQHM